MKINDVLFEDKESNEQVFDAIINGFYFQTYLKPIYDKLRKDKEKLNNNFISTLLQSSELLQELSHHYIIHGSENAHRVSEKVINFEYRKKSRDSLNSVHSYVNDLSNKKIGEPIRNLFFVTKDLGDAVEYGSFYAFIPIDECDFYYHPEIGDFTVTFDTQHLFKHHEFLDEPILKANKTIPFRRAIMEYIKNNDITLTPECVDKIKDYIDLIYEDYELNKDYADYISRYIEKRIEYFRTQIINYLGSIKKVNSIKDVPEKVEVMAKPGRYVLLPTTGSEDDVFVPLGEYYYEHYIKDQT